MSAAASILTATRGSSLSLPGRRIPPALGTSSYPTLLAAENFAPGDPDLLPSGLCYSLLNRRIDYFHTCTSPDLPRSVRDTISEHAPQGPHTLHPSQAHPTLQWALEAACTSPGSEVYVDTTRLFTALHDPSPSGAPRFLLTMVPTAQGHH